MRFALVILFFVGLHYVLQPSSPPPPVIASKQDAIPPVELPPSPSLEKTAATTPAGTAPAPAASAEEADDAQPPPQISGTVEKAGEERTSSYTAPSPDSRSPEIEQRIQKELVRLACYTGRIERSWGPKSRAALRRFTQRAKPKDRTSPNQALLTMLTAYPDNYCRRCRPGQKACELKERRR